jgi:hypothetical protein
MGKVGLQYWVFNESLLNYLLLHIGRCRLLIMSREKHHKAYVARWIGGFEESILEIGARYEATICS